jgi:Flp pilus assembly protein TadD
LADRYPEYRKIIIEGKKSPEFAKNNSAIMIVNQQIQQGQDVSGINVDTLNISTSGGYSPEDSFIQLIVRPLQLLLHENSNLQIVILVDAVDEALSYSGETNIVSLLSSIETLPANVRFIITSRPDNRVETRFANSKTINISSSSFDSQNKNDIIEYTKWRIINDHDLSDKSKDLNDERLQNLLEVLATKADGNFQYVTFLIDSIAKGQQELTNLEALPTGLFELYHDSLRRVIELSRSDWVRDLSPIMGILSVSRESLTISQLQSFTAQSETNIWTNLGNLQQFIERVNINDGPREEFLYRLYHRSFVDFLHSTSINLEKFVHNNYYLSDQDLHKKIVDHYLNKIGELNSQDWKQVDDYGLRHLAEHLYAVEQDSKYLQYLYTLTRNASFLATQNKRLPYEQDLGLKTIQKGLLAASDTDDVEKIVEFLLIHVETFLHTTTIHDSPLVKLTTSNLKNAWDLADTYEIEFSIMWYLLLSWELSQSGRTEEARQTLQKLSEKRLSKLSGWETLDYIILFPHILEVSKDLFYFLSQRLIYDEYRSDLCEAITWGKYRDLSIALDIAQNLEQEWQKADALEKIAFAIQSKDEAREILPKLIRIMSSIKELRLNVIVRQRVGIVYGWFDLTDEASSIFMNVLEDVRNLETPGEQTFGLALVAFGQGSLGNLDEARANLENAMEISKTIQDQEEKNNILKELAGVSASYGDFEKSFIISRLIRNKGVKIEAVSDIAKKESEKNKDEDSKITFARASKIAQSMKDEWQRSSAYEVISNAQAEAGDYTGALDTALRIEGEEAITSSLSYIAVVLAKAGKLDEARANFAKAMEVTQRVKIKVEDQMIKDRKKATYSAFEQSYIIDPIEEILTRTYPSASFEPTQMRSNPLETIYSKQIDAADFDGALDTALKIDDEERRVKALGAISVAQAKAAKVDEARANFARAIELAQHFEYDRVRRNVEGTRTKIKGLLAKLLILSGKFEETSATLERIEDSEVKSLILNAIAAAQAKGGKPDEARENFGKAMELAQQVQDEWISNMRGGSILKRRREMKVTIFPWIRTQATALSTIFLTIIQSGYFDLAISQLRNIDKSLQFYVIRNIAVAQAKGGKPDEARENFGKAMELAQQVQDEWPKSYPYEVISKSEAEAGDFAAALDTALKIDDRKSLEEALSTIAEKQGEAGEFAAALDTALMIDDTQTLENTLISIADKQAEDGKFVNALDTAFFFDDLWNQKEIIVRVAEEQTKAGKLEEARANFTEAIRLISSNENDPFVKKEISTIYAKSGDFSTAIEIASEINSGQYMAEAFEDISSEQARAGNFSAALNTALKIDDEETLEKSLSDIIEKQATAGLYEDAFHTFELIRRNRSTNLTTIARNVAKARDKKYFKLLIISSAYYLDVVYEICLLLVELYPENAAKIEKVLNSFGATSGTNSRYVA